MVASLGLPGLKAAANLDISPRAGGRRPRRRPLAARAAGQASWLSGLLIAAGVALPFLRSSSFVAPGLELPPRPLQPRRRDLLGLTSAGLALPGALGKPAWAEGTPTGAAPVSSKWIAKDGVSFLSSFSADAYGAMRDDARRTPAFIKAIQQRILGKEGKLAFLDIGTGPFALFALVAARAGARKVYAIEANPDACERARDTVAKATDVKPGTIEILEGFTTGLNLPEKVDCVTAEIVGGVASEENCIATIRDAQARLMKNPYDPNSYIPCGIQTYGAPISYALHEMLAPPRFDKLGGQPLRVNCRDRSVQLLADPQVIEDIQFASKDLPGPGKWKRNDPFRFEVSAARLKTNENDLYSALLKEGSSENEARKGAKEVAKTFSGMAFWPRLTLDTAGEIVVESRGPLGEFQRSHWQTVVSLMTPVPLQVKAGSTFDLSYTADFKDDILSPVAYSLQGKLSPV